MQQMQIYGVSFDMVGKQPIVLLKTVDGNKFLPIWIGHPEAAAILMKLQGASTPRPMTHDLLSDVLEQLDAKCERVSVTELRDNTFYASITVSVNGSEMEIDSRPSDALALAVRVSAPIFAAEEVIEESAIEFEHEVEDTEEVVDKFKEFLDEVTPRRLRPGRGFLAAARRGRLQRQLEDPLDQVLEGDPGGLGGLGEEAGVGEAGDRVDLEHLRAVLAEDQVDAGEARAAERLVGAQRRLGDRGGLLAVARPGRRRGAADLVAGFEVVAVAAARDRLDDRQRLAAEHADRQLAAVDEALQQDPVVVAEGRDQRLRHVEPARGELDPQRRAAAARLDHEREAEPLLEPPSASAAPSSRKAVSLKANQSGVGTPAARSSCLARTLSDAAARRRRRRAR